MERKCRILVCLIAAIVIVSALPLAAFAQSADASTNAITTFANLKTAIANATGTADDPAKIYISGMIDQTEELVVNNGQYVHLIGAGTGESGLRRAAVFSGNMIDVGNYNNTYVCGLILDNIVLDGGAVWSDGAGSTNSGISAGNSSLLSVRQKAEATLENGSILRNNAKSAAGGGVYLRGKLEIISGSIQDNASVTSFGGGIQMRDSTTELILWEDAVISGCYAYGDGGGIYQQLGSKLTVNGASLNNNTVASGKSGGAIYVANSNSTLLFHSGEMKGNTAGNNGAAIYVASGANNCSIELFDCTISGNNAGGAGAVYVPGAVGSVKLGGSVCITDNKGASNASSNLFVNTEGALSCIQIAKPFTEYASVGISFAGDVVDGRQIAQKSADFEGSFDLSAQAFFLDEPVENMGAVISGDLVVLADVTARGCTCEGGFTSGKGTVASPYKITSADQLRHVEQHPDASYILAESIDLASVASWTPLCGETPFSGSFDGNGKTVSGMTVNSGTVGGLFACVAKEAVIYNMTLSGSITVGSAMMRAGGLAAVSYGTVKQVTSNVNITVSVDAASAEIGGVVGFNGGLVAFSAYNGTIKGSGRNCNIGAIIGHSKVTDANRLPDMITGHSGFGATSDDSSLKQDNTIDNIIHSINYGPDAIEVDVRTYDANGDGTISIDEFRIAHDASGTANGAKLSDVLSLLLGTHARESELNSAHARNVRIQLDMKENGLIDDVLALLDSLDFPYARIILAGNNTYAHVQENVVAIRAAVAQGMDFWMNPDYILSYDAMANQTDEFIAKIEALGISPFTVNSSYSKMTETIQRKLSDAGIRASVWTLNSVETINAHMLRDVYNITSRMQESLPIREQLRTYGTMANDFSAVSCLPEVGLCSTTGIDERFESNHSFAYACSATCSVCGEANPDAQSCVGKVACADATCQWCGEEVVPAACKDINKDHICDYGCDVYQGSHADGEDTDHLCDYCNQSVGEACYDENTDHACDECGTEMNMDLHADGNDNNHLCDYCNQSVGEVCYDENTDHACDECGTEMHMDLHADGDDNNHLCDYCGQSIGETCYEDDKDHACDECGAEVGTHADVDTDDDHVCDYGCGEKLNDCTGGTATCKELAKCIVCGAEYGALAAHTPNADDGDCTTAVSCSVCNAVTTAAESAHTGGSATCTAKAVCTVCGKAYGELAQHTYDGDTDASCNVCGAERTVANNTNGNENNANGNENNAQNGNTEAPAKKGLSGGAVAGIVIGAVTILGGTGFALFWFVIRKKKA